MAVLSASTTDAVRKCWPDRGAAKERRRFFPALNNKQPLPAPPNVQLGMEFNFTVAHAAAAATDTAEAISTEGFSPSGSIAASV